jgi:hypothetical protein
MRTQEKKTESERERGGIIVQRGKKVSGKLF